MKGILVLWEIILEILKIFHKDVNFQFGGGIRTREDIKFWIGKRAQVGKKIPKKFNKNLKFFDE